MPETVLVCGDRNWTNVARVRGRLEWLYQDAVVITGGARGADTIAHDVATGLGLTTVVRMADWERYGRAAGPIRNRVMLDMKPDLVIAFHQNLSLSRGTADCVREARRRGIPVEVISG